MIQTARRMRQPKSPILKPAFTKANRYLFNPDAWSWSIHSGTTCPGAETCLTFVDRHTGEMRAGAKRTFTCYSAVTERYPSVRARYWANFDAVRGKSEGEIVDVLRCMKKSITGVRIHSAGDFFSQTYFDAWLLFVRENRWTRFWVFTKSLPFWINRMGDIPPNPEIQASYGGRHDALIAQHGLKFAKVVASQEEADALGLRVDTNDILAAFPGESFALIDNFAK